MNLTRSSDGINFGSVVTDAREFSCTLQSARTTRIRWPSSGGHKSHWRRRQGTRRRNQSSGQESSTAEALVTQQQKADTCCACFLLTQPERHTHTHTRTHTHTHTHTHTRARARSLDPASHKRLLRNFARACVAETTFRGCRSAVRSVTWTNLSLAVRRCGRTCFLVICARTSRRAVTSTVSPSGATSALKKWTPPSPTTRPTSTW